MNRLLIHGGKCLYLKISATENGRERAALLGRVEDLNCLGLVRPTGPLMVTSTAAGDGEAQWMGLN